MQRSSRIVANGTHQFCGIRLNIFRIKLSLKTFQLTIENRSCFFTNFDKIASCHRAPVIGLAYTLSERAGEFNFHMSKFSDYGKPAGETHGRKI